MNRFSALTLALTLFPAISFADPSTALTRDEVTVVKRKLQAIQAALGAAPQGYDKASENFQLPTDFSQGDATKASYYPVNASVAMKYDGGSAKLNQKSQTTLMDLQKQMSDAMAKGDYETVSKVQQQMVTASSAMQSEAIAANQKGTIDAGVTLNQGGGNAIDPDAVLFEKPGVLALKSAASPDQEHVTVFFDPVGLKDSKTLSSVTLRAEPTSKKTAVLNAAVDLTGPTAAVEAWAKKIDTGAVLAQLDR